MYEKMIDTVPDSVAAIDSDGYIMVSNNNLFSGYEQGTEGKHLSEIMTDDDLDESAELVKELLRNDDTEYVTHEYELIDADGEHIPVESRFSLLPFEDGEFQGTASVTRDISERKEREEEIKRKNRQLELLNRIV
ncbi:MAG: PAS domain S-box protein, partial [Halobacteria archaeon]|nr:PAS domain S-box protein [Halobacteria archaeon]